MKTKPLLKWALTGILLLLLVACDRDSDSSQPTTESARDGGISKTVGDKVASAFSTEDQRLLAFFEEIFQRDVSQSPEFQAQLGIKTADYGRWDDNSDAHAIAMNAQAEADLQRFHAEFDFDSLSESAKLSYQIFEYNQQRALEAFPWRHHSYAVSQMNSVASAVPTFLQNLHKVETRQDAVDYISRLKGVEGVMAQRIALLQQREALGVVPPMMVYERALPAVRNMLLGAPFEEAAEDGVLLADFRAKLEALELAEEDQDLLLNEAANALSGPFRAGYQALGSELERLQSLAESNDGVWALPNGEDYYANRVRFWTTVTNTPEEIHLLGLDDVARIRAEMETIKTDLGFEGDLAAFFEFVRSNPENYYPNTDAGRAEYLQEATALIEGIYDMAGEYFNVLPKAPLEVRRVEPWRESGSSTAFYNRPAPDGSRPGIYYVNLQDMNAVQKHIMNSLAYHEGAPGHHFQLAIQQELEGVPEFRKFEGYSAYWEGWALYAERLAFEAGLYEGLPMRNFGRLSEEMKRAVRLVVDTGMHAKRWTREQCIAYMTANTPMAPDDIERQIERYFVMPGQALSYKVGMEAILELRARAQAALGDEFDIREFHDIVLKNGAMPMEILGQVVDATIASH
jgi:uncharacterized protein (DUF885 family)